jgi:thiosulfate dehydrogenase
MWLSGLPNVAVRRALGAFFRLGLIGAAAIASRAGLVTAGARAQAPARPAYAQSAGIWTVPEVGALPRDASGLEIRKGRDLITATYAYIGPDVADASNRYAGNNLACSNCHLEAGTKKFGLPLFGLYSDFPQYSARTGGEISIEDRVNSCMRRSMNGRALPTDAPEMQAIVAYIKFISSGVAPDQRLPGLGTGKMPELDRAAEPARGEPLYLRDCAACHNSQGSGERQGIPGSDFGYVFPPLWGPSRRRWDGADHYACQLHPFQHAARHRLP